MKRTIAVVVVVAMCLGLFAPVAQAASTPVPMTDAEMALVEGEGALLVVATAGIGAVAKWTAGGAVVGGVLHVITDRPTSDIWRSMGSGATAGFFTSPPVRAAFAARHVPDFVRWTIGATGSASWHQGRR